MLIKLSKLKHGFIYKNKEVMFESENKQKDNLVIIPTENEDLFFKTISSGLFKPSLLRYVYTPFVIKPLNRKVVRIKRRDYYKNATDMTNGQLRPGMFSIAACLNRNIIYDSNIEFRQSIALAKKIYGTDGVRIYKIIQDLLEKTIKDAIKDSDYTNNMVVFPLSPIKGMRNLIISNKYSDENILDPTVIFLRKLKEAKGSLEHFKSLFPRIRFILVYSLQAKSFLMIDLEQLKEEQISIILERAFRLQKTTLGDFSEISREDIDETDYEKNDEEAKDLNQLEEIRDNILNKNMTKSLSISKAELEPETMEEESQFENLNKIIKQTIFVHRDKTTKEIEEIVSNDEEIKKQTLKFLSMKKGREKQVNKTNEAIEQQNELIDNFFEAEVKLIDERNKLEGDEILITDERLRPFATSPISSFDKEYSEKVFKEDIINIFSSFSHNTVLPLTLSNFKIVDASDNKNYQDRIYATFKAIGRTEKKISIVVNIPKLYNDYFLYIGGTRFSFNKQLVMLPITKTQPDEVKIMSNANIFFMSRTSGRLSENNDIIFKVLKEYRNKDGFEVIEGDSSIENTNLGINDIEFLELSSELYKINSSEYEIIFDSKVLHEELLSEGFTPNKDKQFIVVAKEKSTGGFVYINENGAVFSIMKAKDGRTIVKPLASSLFNFIINNVLKYDISKLPKLSKKVVYTQIKIAGNKYPLIIILSMLWGLQKVLNTYGIKYKTSFEPLNNTDRTMNVIKFKDCYLYYENKIENEILLSGLDQTLPHEFTLSEYNGFAPFDKWIGAIKGLSPALKRHFKNTMNVTLSSFLDPITIEVLKHFHMPYEPLKLLLEANTLLKDNKHLDFQDMRNYRLRGYEQIAAALYYSLNEAYSNYMKAYLNGASLPIFDIDENVIIKQLHQLPTVNSYSALNPMNELNEITKASQRGFLGINMTDSYSLKNRGFSTQQLALQSAMATGAAGGVGVNRDLIYKPKDVSDLRGYVDKTFDVKTADATNMLAPSELLLPFSSTHDDPQRIAMLNTQSTHTMPIKNPSKRLWSSGFEDVLPSILSDDFAFKAKNDGKVISIDEENKIAIVEYVDGRKDSIDLSETYLRNSASSFYIKQSYVFKLKVGDTFKKNEVIAFNKDYFDLNDDRKGVHYTMGALSKIALLPGDTRYNDACVITAELDKQLTSSIVLPVSVELPVDTQIKSMVKEGDNVEVADELISFITAGGDIETANFIKSLTSDDDLTEDLYSNSKESKYHGKVVSITVHYNVPFEKLSTDLQKLVKQSQVKQEKREQATKGTNAYNIRLSDASQQSEDAREDGIKYEGVLIRFFIESEIGNKPGNKLTFDTALKGIISKVLEDDEAPYSEYRPDENILAVMSPTGFYSRKTGSIYYLMYTNKALIELGRQIKKIWEE